MKCAASKSGIRKIERAIRAGWPPSLPPAEFYRRKKRRISRQEATCDE